MNNTTHVNVSELAKELHQQATNFREVWPQWMEFLTEMHRRGFPHWKDIEGNIWIASHHDIAQYINATDEQGKAAHPRSFSDESADFAGYREYAHSDPQLTQIYARMNPPYPGLEQQIFNILTIVREHDEPACSQNARRAVDAFSELQSSLNAYRCILPSSHRHPNDVAKDVADCLILTAEALQNSSNKNNHGAQTGADPEHGTFRARAVNVMVASPSDVADERKAIRELIYEWNSSNAENEGVVLIPRMWETDATPQMGNRPQEILNQQLLRNSALLVAVFWTRIGTPTGKAQSGTVEEIREHVGRGRPTMIYFSKKKMPQDTCDGAQYQALQEYQDECKKNGLISEFADLDSLKEQLRRHLHNTIKANFPRGAIPTTPSAVSSVSEGVPADLTGDEQALLYEAAQDPNGQVTLISLDGGKAVVANNHEINQRRDNRETQKWIAVVESLKKKGMFVLDKEQDGAGYYKVTHHGYEAADGIKAKRSLKP